MNLEDLGGSPLKRRKANHSPLMIAKGKASLGEPVNFCPFGCGIQDLDENGYCYHLVGFTVPGNDKRMEVMGAPNGERQRKVSGKPVAVEKGDKLERITVCSRVYRNLERPPWAVVADDDADEVEEGPEEKPGKKKKQAAGVE